MNRASTEQKNQAQISENSLQLQGQNYRYEGYLFKNQIKKYFKSTEVLSEGILKKLQGRSLSIKHSKCKEIWTKIIVNIIQAEIDQIDYRVNNNSNIIKEISNIYLKQLKTLYLHQNNISSIELLPILNCQQLHNICLDSNKISRINCMKKWNNSNLCWFALANNPILQIHSYTKIKFPKILTYLRFEQTQDHNIISEDLSILVKLDNQMMSYLDYQKKRINQPKIFSMIKIRHSPLEA